MSRTLLRMDDAPVSQSRGPSGPTPRSLWGQQVLAEALELRSRLDLAGMSGADTSPAREREIIALVMQLTDLAMNLAAEPPARSRRQRLHDWWTGSRVEMCWAYLHSAEVHLATLDDPAIWQATARSALAHAERLPDKDPDRRALAALLGRES